MTRYMAVLAGALAVAACNADSNSAATSQDNGNAAMPAEETAPESPVPSATSDSAQQFVNTIAASDVYEIEAARLAQKNGTSQATKDFAAMMIKDHTASTSALKAAARKSQPPVVPDPALAPDQQEMLDALKAAKADFDKVYAEQQVAAHTKASGVLTTYAQSGSDSALEDFATQTAPMVQGHLSKARELPGK